MGWSATTPVFAYLPSHMLFKILFSLVGRWFPSLQKGWALHNSMVAYLRATSSYSVCTEFDILAHDEDGIHANQLNQKEVMYELMFNHDGTLNNLPIV